jgi:hypothetical protein
MTTAMSAPGTKADRPRRRRACRPRPSGRALAAVLRIRTVTLFDMTISLGRLLESFHAAGVLVCAT